MVYLLFFILNTYAVRGGSSRLGADCGSFCIILSDGNGYYSWYRGAALS